MSKYRTPSDKSPYFIPKEDYLTAVHYSLRYPLWKEKFNMSADTRGAIRYDKDKVQTTNDFDSTSEMAIRLSGIWDKIQLVDEVIRIASDGSGLDDYLRLGVCYGLTFFQLKERKIPCEREMYYRIRRKYYYELSLRI